MRREGKSEIHRESTKEEYGNGQLTPKDAKGLLAVCRETVARATCRLDPLFLFVIMHNKKGEKSDLRQKGHAVARERYSVM